MGWRRCAVSVVVSVLGVFGVEASDVVAAAALLRPGDHEVPDGAADDAADEPAEGRVVTAAAADDERVRPEDLQPVEGIGALLRF